MLKTVDAVLSLCIGEQSLLSVYPAAAIDVPQQVKSMKLPEDNDVAKGPAIFEVKEREYYAVWVSQHDGSLVEITASIL